MLARLLVMFTAVILLAVLLMLAVFALTSRQAQVDSRINALKVQAYDIAYLASAAAPTGLEAFFNLGRNATRQMMERKLRAVYEDYAAYFLVVDRTGHITGYFSEVISQHSELQGKLDAVDISNTLLKVLQGEEVVIQTRGQAGPMFTVAVPWVQRGSVVGAVYIQTAAQTIQASYASIWQRAGLAALFTFLFAAAIAVVYTRRLVVPLKKMAGSAALMARGLPAQPAEHSGFTELDELAAAFNHMSGQIHDTEQTRRAFIANLSHELRSPMTSIQGFVQGLLDDTVKEEQRKQILQIVLDETGRLNRLVSDLLTLSRMEATEQGLKPIVFDICELARRVIITKLSAIEEKQLTIDTQFEREQLFALAEREQIEQVLINLLDNAIRYTPSGGQIVLEVQAIDRQTLSVTVRDNGIGVSQEDARHIFDRFYKADTSHASGEGVGLGLAICKAILERHGQSIRLLEAEQGASFQFTLDRAQDKDGRPHANQSARED